MSEAIYISRDNAFGFALTEDGDVQTDLSFITRVILTVDGDGYDSDVLGSSKIWWTDTETVSGVTAEVLQFKLGAESEIVAGAYYDCRLVIYDATNTNGVVWVDDMEVVIK